VNSAWRKCLMFLCSISRSIVGPSVIAVYSSSVPFFGSGTSIDDIPPGQFIFDGSSDIICFVSFALWNICAARFVSISGFIATKAASCSSSMDVFFVLCSLISCLQFFCAISVWLLLRLCLLAVLFLSLARIVFVVFVSCNRYYSSY
jgi:hypothetical protein